MHHARILLTGIAAILVVIAPFSPSQKGVACTTFMAANDQRVILGDSEDAGADHPLANNPAGGMVFFLPSSPGQFGRMHLG